MGFTTHLLDYYARNLYLALYMFVLLMTCLSLDITEDPPRPSVTIMILLVLNKNNSYCSNCFCNELLFSCYFDNCCCFPACVCKMNFNMTNHFLFHHSCMNNTNCLEFKNICQDFCTICWLSHSQFLLTGRQWKITGNLSFQEFDSAGF